MSSSTPPHDPLTSPLKATLLFGSVFLIAFVVNVVRAVVFLGDDARRAAHTGPGANAMLLGWLGFALSSGCTVAFVRRRNMRMARKNLTTGLVVGAFYSLACQLTFGATMRFSGGALVLVIGVWLGVAYAVTSGLNEVARG